MSVGDAGEAGRGSLVGHVIKRIFFALMGYGVSLLVGLVAIVAIYAFASYLPNAPSYFDAIAMSPIAMLFIPPLWILYLIIACAATIVPAALWMLASEALSLRSLWLHMLAGLASAAIGYLLLGAQTVGAGQLPDLGIVTAAGPVGGFVYWLIAGRDAGFRRPV